MGRHALLSASSSHRWLACPPSARLCENYEDTGSEYAQQGTDAHSLCEHKLKLSLGMETEDPTEGLSFYDEEMEECACGYADYVLSLVEEAKRECKDPVVLIEQRLDFSRYVEEGFGTGDCVVIADGTLYIIDYKHGKGVEVSAEGNPQMMLYALGALELFDGIYDIDTVRMAIYQPRRENVSVYAMAKDDLLQWAEGELSEKAKLAYAGEGEFCAGEHCRFCKAKAVCRKRAEYNLELAKYDFEMLHSLEAQVSYYSGLIQNHSGWEYAGVYADEARTGTKDTRENFVRLLADCRAGKIDMVLTKSISRFARNTVTLLETVRELKQIGVDVYFEEQNIHSLSTDGELMLTVLASYAQEESRSASENQKWRIKKNFEEGKPWSSTLLGYRNVNGRYEIVPEEAETVRMIFDWYLEGMGATAIRDRLNAMGIKTRLGNKWSRSPILKLLRNYAYTGNLLLQKTYRENHITKKCIRNTGEKPMYHATGTHEAIIDMDTFNQVQEEIRRRAEHFKHKEGTETPTYPFTGMVRCCRCGKNYIRSGAPAYRTWICRTRRKEGLEHCGADIIPEDELFRLTAEVLGGGVTEDAVRDKITAIRAEENRTLVFCLKNGKETVKQWQEHEVVHICTEEQKRQISLKNSGRKQTEEQRRRHSERMKEYWKGREFPEEQRRRQSEKMKAYWNDREASDAHRQTVSRMMKEMRAGNTGAGKEGDGNA